MSRNSYVTRTGSRMLSGDPKRENRYASRKGVRTWRMVGVVLFHFVFYLRCQKTRLLLLVILRRGKIQDFFFPLSLPPPSLLFSSSWSCPWTHRVAKNDLEFQLFPTVHNFIKCFGSNLGLVHFRWEFYQQCDIPSPRDFSSYIVNLRHLNGKVIIIFSKNNF